VRSQIDRVFRDDPRFEGNDSWWDSDQLFKRPDSLFGTRTSDSFTIGDEEVARALVCAERSSVRGYDLPLAARGISEVQFIEVRPYSRSRGLGLAVPSELCQLHRSVMVALALPDAVDFWRHTGWHEVAPDDGDELRTVGSYAVT
jgi:hypothetical protein